LSRVFANVIALVIGGAIWLCGLASITSMGRIWWAFARDDGMPGAGVLKRVSSRHGTTAAAIVAASLLSVLTNVYGAAYPLAPRTIWFCGRCRASPSGSLRTGDSRRGTASWVRWLVPSHASQPLRACRSAGMIVGTICRPVAAIDGEVAVERCHDARREPFGHPDQARVGQGHRDVAVAGEQPGGRRRLLAEAEGDQQSAAAHELEHRRAPSAQRLQQEAGLGQHGLTGEKGGGGGPELRGCPFVVAVPAK